MQHVTRYLEAQSTKNLHIKLKENKGNKSFGIVGEDFT